MKALPSSFCDTTVVEMFTCLLLPSIEHAHAAKAREEIGVSSLRVPFGFLLAFLPFPPFPLSRLFVTHQEKKFREHAILLFSLWRSSCRVQAGHREFQFYWLGRHQYSTTSSVRFGLLCCRKLEALEQQRRTEEALKRAAQAPKPLDEGGGMYLYEYVYWQMYYGVQNAMKWFGRRRAS
jgi:hypothetical protein